VSRTRPQSCETKGTSARILSVRAGRLDEAAPDEIHTALCNCVSYLI
jgi:hypothetical protein